MKASKALATVCVLLFALMSVTAPNASGQDKVKLRFWKMPGQANEAETAFYADLIKRFQAENPNVEVEHLIIPWDSGFEKYTATLAGGDVPDVTYQILPWLNSFLGQGAITPLESLGDTAPLFEGVYESIANGSRAPDGNHYGVPYYGSHFVMAVNTDVWERAGSPPLPTTYAEMVPFAQKLTFDKNGKHPGEPDFDKNNIEVYGFAQPGAWDILTNYIWNYFWAYGADVSSEDGKDIGFNNEQGRAALQVMKDMVDSGAATPINLYPDAAAWSEAIVSGRVGMSWMERLTPEMVEKYPNARVKVLEMPAGPAGKFIVGGAGYLAIPAKSEHKEEALAFIKFATNTENVTAYLRQTLLYPVKPLGDNLYAGIGEPRESFMNEAAKQAQYVRLTRVGLPYNPEEVMIAEINNFLTGQKDMDTMLEDLSRQVQIMARNAGM
jgi:ABC-type glycerol-3-phosphate transport system substrate-binding protein